MKRALWLVVAVAILGLGMSTGCKSQEEKVCEHLAEILDEGDDYATGGECTKDLGKFKEKYSNMDEVYDCFLEAKDENGLEKCLEKGKSK